MKRPKRIMEEIPSEDLEQMKRAERHIKIEIFGWEYKEIPRKQAKNELGEQYFRGLNRATFHRTACQIKDDIHYHFILKI